MLVGAYPPRVQECAWTNLQEEHRSWQGINYKSFREDGIAQLLHLPSVPLH